ncbi:DEAD/DEAH box helicase [Flavobacterium phragmitis]|uniref:Superfamily II DNA or RNA helicase n=1 Tax=Flavobacterium phragmitis TaxID=739143 RepID=A0A1I1LG10_9FLAO|nr:DEAD/DEAH box helicase family protein [Flavobacterium phragmitis]SFC72044.1 Superfamily II DNA or RNA helicase [Flavobacterium phragmitis]
MTLKLPKVSNLIYKNKGNEIWQSFASESTLDNIEIVSVVPCIIKFNMINYHLTSDKDWVDSNISDYVLLVNKKPTRKDLESNSIIIKQWLKHPSFVNLSPNEVVETWTDKFRFVKENEKKNIKGLRPPQIGALYSILSHLQNPEERAIVVMPTGTGKTETMLSALISNQCQKLLVTVPSDSLRTQLSEKFMTLGLLKKYGIVDPLCYNPIVGIINTGFDTIEDLKEFVSKSNVVVSTMNILTGLDNSEKTLLNEYFSHLFIDEAHHSEARTWKDLIDKFDKEKVFLFTATPYRNDGKNLTGKIIFNFSLKKAQDQKYYKEINYLPIREYNQKLADEKIAEKAVGQLRKDIDAGYKHILMARCVNKIRAQEVFQHYKKYKEFNPVVVYTNVAGLSKKIEAIKNYEHSIIVCVNMLGEGFDLPNLKIAAIHDERQSLPITLQFIGRFTRTSYDNLGNPSFITNIAYPPIQEELDRLYSSNSDWNLILPRLSADATQKEMNIKEFLENFKNLNNSNISFQEINPAMSTVIFKNISNTWNPSNWESGIASIEDYEHKFSDTNGSDTLVIILGKVEKVEWGNFETVKNLGWDIIIIHWDLRPGINRVFLNTSFKNYSSTSLMNTIFGEHSLSQITGMNVFRIFHDVNRLSLYNVGTRKGIGEDITFQSYFGKGVQDGIKELEQGNLIKNNIFGVGYKNGEKISLGCSVKGKIWSYQRGNLDELTKWCRSIGEIVEDNDIDPNVVLQHTLAISKISERPKVMPMLIDWHPEMYEFSESRYQIHIERSIYDISTSELNLVNPTIDQPIRFTLDTTDYSLEFEFQVGLDIKTNEPYYKIIQISNTDCSVYYGNKKETITEFLNKLTPTIWFADGSQLFQNLHVQLKEKSNFIPVDKIIANNWDGIDISKESQDIAPYIQDSIQYNFIKKIENDFQIIYDDDGKGEIADIIGINDSKTQIDVHLYHLKFAKHGLVNNNIENFYQVCGQAQKSLKWKHRKGREFFNHLFRRINKTLNGNSSSRLIKGTEEDMDNLLNQAKWSKEIIFHIYIVQPSLSKAKASEDILLLLGSVYHYLHTVGNIELKVYTSD